ncbi:polyprenyl synthetase family protein [Streptomyces longispororuber]|uniref:polyprenyl synthetase family protein n=1 Tax=Streptomyces longispororuber TaxID=68230 RepID=UPI003F551E12
MRPSHAHDHPTTAPPRLVAVAEASAARAAAAEDSTAEAGAAATLGARAAAAEASGAGEACGVPAVEACGAAPPRISAADAGTGTAPARWWDPASGELSAWGPREVREIDADVPGAVGRMLGHVLTERLHRARQADAVFTQELAERVTRFTLRGGKRMRARLVWWATRACAGRDPAAAAAALRVGAALELLQTCALVHDDVMDRASLRRGRPALHADVAADHVARVGCERADRFGQSAAILAGDLALAWADDLVAQTPLTDWTAGVVRRLWSDMRTEMVAGQYLDVRGQVTAARSLPRALRAACLKSAAYSVERPLALGAAVAGADEATLRRLGEAGRCAGLAFQLRDDLDDVFGDPRETGKACGGDIREGKPTYPVAVARARAEAAGDLEALAVLERWLGDVSLTASGLAQVREVLVATGARAAVEAKIERLAARSLRHVDGARLAPEGAAELRGLLLAVAGARPGANPAARPTRGEQAAHTGAGACDGSSAGAGSGTSAAGSGNASARGNPSARDGISATARGNPSACDNPSVRGISPAARGNPSVHDSISARGNPSAREGTSAAGSGNASARGNPSARDGINATARGNPSVHDGTSVREGTSPAARGNPSAREGTGARHGSRPRPGEEAVR